MIALQQIPKFHGVSRHAVRSADQKQRHISDGQRTLCLRGKIYMAGRVQQRQCHAAGLHPGHLRKNRNSAFALQFVGIKKGIPMVHSSCPADRTAQIEHALGQCRLSCVHRG